MRHVMPSNPDALWIVTFGKLQLCSITSLPSKRFEIAAVGLGSRLRRRRSASSRQLSFVPFGSENSCLNFKGSPYAIDRFCWIRWIKDWPDQKNATMKQAGGLSMAEQNLPVIPRLFWLSSSRAPGLWGVIQHACTAWTLLLPHDQVVGWNGISSLIWKFRSSHFSKLNY